LPWATVGLIFATACAVQKILGHESIATTEHYVAVDDSEIRAAMMAAVDGESW
jgi:site-specific recombinase XerD